MEKLSLAGFSYFQSIEVIGQPTCIRSLLAAAFLNLLTPNKNSVLDILKSKKREFHLTMFRDRMITSWPTTEHFKGLR